MSDNIEFAAFVWRRRKIGAAFHTYRVYKPDGSFVSVEANTAAEAFKLSGVGGATKILREYNAHSLVIGEGVLVDDGAAIPAAKAPPPATDIVRAPRESGAPAPNMTPAAPSEMNIPPVQASAPSADTAGASPQFANHELSKEEVNKLLGN